MCLTASRGILGRKQLLKSCCSTYHRTHNLSCLLVYCIKINVTEMIIVITVWLIFVLFLAMQCVASLLGFNNVHLFQSTPFCLSTLVVDLCFSVSISVELDTCTMRITDRTLAGELVSVLVARLEVQIRDKGNRCLP